MSTAMRPPRFRILPPSLVLLLLLSILALWGFLPGPELLPAPWRWLGVPVTLLSVVILMGASRQFHAAVVQDHIQCCPQPPLFFYFENSAGSRTFDRAGTNIKTFDAPGTLVTTGWFRFSRNPMYVGFTLLLVGAAAVAGCAFALASPIVFALISARIYIPFEESALSRAFGDAYETYRRRVRRWL